MDESLTRYACERVPATKLSIGDRVRLIGNVYFTVEWAGVDIDVGSVMLAGTTSTGRPHTSHLSEFAMVDRLA